MTTLLDLKKICESTTPGEWRTGIHSVSQCGYDLDTYFAATRGHRDNPRKNHYELAEIDRVYIATFNPTRTAEMIELLMFCENLMVCYTARTDPNDKCDCDACEFHRKLAKFEGAE